MMNYIAKGAWYVLRKTAFHPYSIIFFTGAAFGAVLGSGVLSSPKYETRYEQNLESIADDCQKQKLSDSRLIELLKK